MVLPRTLPWLYVLNKRAQLWTFHWIARTLPRIYKLKCANYQFIIRLAKIQHFMDLLEENVGLWRSFVDQGKPNMDSFRYPGHCKAFMNQLRVIKDIQGLSKTLTEYFMDQEKTKSTVNSLWIARFNFFAVWTSWWTIMDDSGIALPWNWID